MLPFLSRSPRWKAAAFAASAALLFLAAPRARAVVQTFAQFTNNGVNNFTYTNTGGTSATFSANNIPIQFNYSNIVSLPAELAGNQMAHLTLTSSTTATASQDVNFTDSQILNNTTTLTITRDAPASFGTGSKTVLLAVTITSGSTAGALLQGADGGSQATLGGSSRQQTVTFTSDFLSFYGTTRRDLGLSFSSLVNTTTSNGGLLIAANNFFESFNAAGTGTFSSDPVPTVIPEGDALPALGLLFGIAGVWELFRRFRQGWSVVGREG